MSRRRFVMPEELPRYVGKPLFLPVPNPLSWGTTSCGVKKLTFTGLHDVGISNFQFSESKDEQPHTWLHINEGGKVFIGNHVSYLFRNFWLAYAYGLDWSKHATITYNRDFRTLDITECS